MLRTISLPLFLLAAAVISAAAQELGPGDYGYLHTEYHHWGSIDELREKTGTDCCDEEGECRAAYVNMRTRMAYIDGKWCPLPTNQEAIRADVSLPPNGYTLVCAGFSSRNSINCPSVYCVALPENQ